MKFILVLFLLIDGEVSDTRAYPNFESKQACEIAAKQAEEHYKSEGAHVVGRCYTSI